MTSAREMNSEKFFPLKLCETETPLEGFLKGSLKENEPFEGLFLSSTAVFTPNQMRYCRKRERAQQHVQMDWLQTPRSFKTLFVHFKRFSFLSPAGHSSSLLFLFTFILHPSPKVMYRQMELFISDPCAQYSQSWTCTFREFDCFLRAWVSAVNFQTSPFPHCNWRP